MLIQIIQENVEERFLETLEDPQNKMGARVVLLCAFSETFFRPSVDNVLADLKDVLSNNDGELYFCEDGDLAIIWRGRIKEIKAAITHIFLSRYPAELSQYPEADIFRIFEASTHGEDLRLIFRNKLQKKSFVSAAPKQVVAETASAYEAWDPVFSPVQLQCLENALKLKKTRRKPVFLVVEDQDFSRKLLTQLLAQRYTCYAAKDSRQAIQLYANHAPDLTFLDIELPDADGHQLAALFRKHDAGSYVVMVTGNNQVDDVVKAKANKVQGFIVKPYNKQKIMAAVDTFVAKRGRV